MNTIMTKVLTIILLALVGSLIHAAGVQAKPTVFMLTDKEIKEESFLEYINIFLNTGELPNLYDRSELDSIVGELGPLWEADPANKGVEPSPSKILAFFIGRVRANLHLVLCFSPIGDPIKVRTRRFPALVNCVVIDWFQPWPEEALTSVSKKFLDDLDLGTEASKENIINFMPYSFLKVNEVSESYRELDRRFNYTTPKSFLELIALYTSMLDKRRAETNALIKARTYHTGNTKKAEARKLEALAASAPSAAACASSDVNSKTSSATASPVAALCAATVAAACVTFGLPMLPVV